MKGKPIVLAFLLMVGWLLAACTTTGESIVTAVSSTSEVATAVATPIPTIRPTATSANVRIQHDGITLTYDPTLFGDAVIQDVPASADQGLFDQPSPAYTRIGFAPSGIRQDSGYHWMLALDPSITIYNLNDFGSYAIGDRYTRAQIAQFQDLLDQRPSTITETIPVILPVNAGQIIRTQVKWLDFGSGAGVRFLTQYDQAPSPINNEGLIYIFQGMTNDGLHGVTAVFPLNAAFLPDGFAMDEAAYTAFIENFDAEMTAAIEQLNTAVNSDFNPHLSQLDALVQSIAVVPTETDFPMTTNEPQYGQALADADIFNAPDSGEVIGSLPASATVIMNAASKDGRYRRILCPDGSTGSCWVPTEAVAETTSEAGPVFYAGGTPEEGAVVGITAVSTNPIYDGPGGTYRLVGELVSGENASVLGVDITNWWLAIECPGGIAQACWVSADTAVNEPTAFVVDDGWQAVTGEYVSFRVPDTWQPTAVTPGMGSVLEEWNLGVPGVESDQTLAFFTVAFDLLQPTDLESETPFEIGGQPGAKWMRSGQGYVSYDYYTTGIAGAGSFGIHITVPEADAALEAAMDMLAASVTFNK